MERDSIFGPWGRRKFLQSIISSSIGAAALSQLSDEAAASKDFKEKPHVWRKNKRKNKLEKGLTDYANELCSSVTYFGSIVNTRDQWQHDFNVCATFTTRQLKPESKSFSADHSITNTVLNVNNEMKDTVSLFDSKNPDRVGAKPEPDPKDKSVNYGNAAFTVFVGALSLASKSLAPYLLAGQIVLALSSGGQNESGEIFDYTWNYDFDAGLPANAHHYYDFFFVANNTRTSAAQFYVYQDGNSDQPIKGRSPSIGRRFHVDPAGGSASVNGAKISSGTVTSGTPGSRSFEDVDGTIVPNRKIPEGTHLEEFAAGGPIKWVALPTYVNSEPSDDVIDPSSI